MKYESISVGVMSSDGFNVYKVEFIRDNGKLGVACDCAAGARGKVCKHKLGLLMSNSDSFELEGAPEAFAQIKEWIMASSYPSLLHFHDDALAKYFAAKEYLELAKYSKLYGDAVAKHASAKEHLTLARYRLEKAMRDAEGAFL